MSNFQRLFIICTSLYLNSCFPGIISNEMTVHCSMNIKYRALSRIQTPQKQFLETRQYPLALAWFILANVTQDRTTIFLFSIVQKA